MDAEDAAAAVLGWDACFRQTWRMLRSRPDAVCVKPSDKNKQTIKQTKHNKACLWAKSTSPRVFRRRLFDFTPWKQPGNLMENVLMAAHIKQHYTWQVMRLSGSQSMNGKASNTTQVCAVVMSFLIKQGKQIKRRQSFPDCSRLTSGCISACISASCTALGTWNLSISSIILATRLFPPFSSKVNDGSGSFRRVITEIVSDLRFLIIFVVFRWRTTSQQAVCRRWCDQLDDGDSTTHFRVWHPKIGYRDPRGPSKEG